MKSVFLAPGWPPSGFRNGIVTAVSALAQALRSLGHDARILALEGESQRDAHVAMLRETAPPRRELAPLRILRYRLAPGHNVYHEIPVRIARSLSSEQLAGAEILEMEESFGWSARVAARTCIPVVTRLHGPWIMNGAALKGADKFDHGDFKRIRLEGEAIASATAITAPSQYVLDLVRSYYSLNASSGVVIANPVNCIEPKKIWRAENADRNRILFVGRFDRHKGADILLRAFSFLATERPSLRLEFIGPNHERITEGGVSYSFDEYIRSIMAPAASERIDILGPISREAVEELRPRSFVTVIASRDENFGNVVLEAMAAGSPIVATNVGGTPEAARDGVEALLAAPEPQALAARIAELLDNPALAASLGEKARARAEREYAPAKIAAATAAFHADVIARHRAERRKAS